MIVYAVLCGFLLDLLLGDPAWMPHPVIYMGKAITKLERILRPRFPKTEKGEFTAGCVLAAVLPVGSLLFFGGCWWLGSHLIFLVFQLLVL